MERAQLLLDQIVNLGMYQRYSADGHNYIHIKNFLKYQRINRPTPSKIPNISDISLNTHGELSEDSVSTHSERKGKEDKGKENNGNEDEEEGKERETISSPPSIRQEAQIISNYLSDLFGNHKAPDLDTIEGNLRQFGPEIICRAIAEAKKYKKLSWGYIEKILQGWDKEGPKGNSAEASRQWAQIKAQYG